MDINVGSLQDKRKGVSSTYYLPKESKVNLLVHQRISQIPGTFY